MPSLFWYSILTISFICAIMTGRVNELSAALLTSGKQAFELLLAFGGMLCVWNGVMNVAKNSGITTFFSRLLKPVIGLLFPKYKKNQEICEYISMNMTANLLGLGNAATPAGLRAIAGMAQLDGNERASPGMIRLAVLNSASIQLLPTTIAAVRLSAGSASPFDILPAVWLTSACALVIGMTATTLFEKITRRETT